MRQVTPAFRQGLLVWPELCNTHFSLWGSLNLERALATFIYLIFKDISLLN